MRQTRKRHYPNELGQDGLQSVEMQITEEAMASLRERVEAMGAKEEAMRERVEGMEKTLEWSQKQMKMLLNSKKRRAFYIRGVHESQHQQMQCHPGKTYTII